MFQLPSGLRQKERPAGHNVRDGPSFRPGDPMPDDVPLSAADQRTCGFRDGDRVTNRSPVTLLLLDHDEVEVEQRRGSELPVVAELVNWCWSLAQTGREGDRCDLYWPSIANNSNNND
jgi:hypothetical protein